MNRIDNLDIRILGNPFKRIAHILEGLPKALPSVAGDQNNLFVKADGVQWGQRSYFLSDIFFKQRKSASILVLPTTKIRPWGIPSLKRFSSALWSERNVNPKDGLSELGSFPPEMGPVY